MSLVDAYLECIEDHSFSLIDEYLRIATFSGKKIYDSWLDLYRNHEGIIVVNAPRRSGKTYHMMQKVMHNDWNKVLWVLPYRPAILHHEQRLNEDSFMLQATAQREFDRLSKTFLLTNESGHTKSICMAQVQSLIEENYRGLRYDAIIMEELHPSMLDDVFYYNLHLLLSAKEVYIIGSDLYESAITQTIWDQVDVYMEIKEN